jgi:hypothetical protein
VTGLGPPIGGQKPPKQGFPKTWANTHVLAKTPKRPKNAFFDPVYPYQRLINCPFDPKENGQIRPSWEGGQKTCFFGPPKGPKNPENGDFANFTKFRQIWGIWPNPPKTPKKPQIRGFGGPNRGSGPPPNWGSFGPPQTPNFGIPGVRSDPPKSGPPFLGVRSGPPKTRIPKSGIWGGLTQTPEFGVLGYPGDTPKLGGPQCLQRPTRPGFAKNQGEDPKKP